MHNTNPGISGDKARARGRRARADGDRRPPGHCASHRARGRHRHLTVPRHHRIRAARDAARRSRQNPRQAL